MAEYKLWQTQKYATSKKKEVLAAALFDENYCIQLKKDGSSYVLAKDLDGSVHLYGDKISKKTGVIIDKIENVPHMKAFAEENFPNGSQLVVEICYGESSKDVNTIMLALPEKAIARQLENKVCQAYVFDILFWDNQSYYEKDFADRWNKVIKVSQTMKADWLSIAETFYENKSDIITDWLTSGEEGGVLKMLHSTKKTSAAHAVSELGATAKRPMNTTYKIKQVDTADVVIIGIEMPTSEYTGKDAENHPYKDADGNAINRLYALGMANAFTIGAYQDGNLIKIGTVASGLDDEMRKSASDDPDIFIGATIEIECMSKDNTSRTLRHPRLIHIREDKAAEACTMEEIFG